MSLHVWHAGASKLSGRRAAVLQARQLPHTRGGHGLHQQPGSRQLRVCLHWTGVPRTLTECRVDSAPSLLSPDRMHMTYKSGCTFMGNTNAWLISLRIKHIFSTGRTAVALNHAQENVMEREWASTLSAHSHTPPATGNCCISLVSNIFHPQTPPPTHTHSHPISYPRTPVASPSAGCCPFPS